MPGDEFPEKSNPGSDKGPGQTPKEEAQQAYSSLLVLVDHRADIFAAVQKIFDKINREISPNNVGQFLFSMDRIVKLQEKMDGVRQEMIRLNQKLSEKYRVSLDKQQEQFDGLIENCQALYLINKEKAEATKSSTARTGVPSNHGENKVEHQVKLPRLELPKFSGKLRDWSAFHSLFETSIHKSKSLSNMEKFQYLISRLEGEAKQLVGTLELTAENYIVAWDALCLRYNNERRHIHYHLSSLLELPDAPQNTALPGLLSKVREHMNALTALKRNENEYALLLTTVIIQKLSFGIRRRFEDSREDSTKYPEFKELESFLQGECAQLDNYKSKFNNDPAPKNTYNKGGNSRNFVSIGPKEHNGKKTNKNRNQKCALCSENHPLYWCEDFKNLPVDSRIAKVKSWNRCKNCLSDTHSDARNCKCKYTCKICREPHHTLLHIPEKSFVATSSGCERDSQNPSISCVNVNLPAQVKGSKDHSILLGTALVGLKLSNGHFETVRAVIDSAAMSTFITKTCAQRLGLKINEYHAEVSGLGNQNLKFWGDVDISIKPLHQQRPVLTTKAEVLTIITDQLPTTPLNPEIVQQWQHLTLADRAMASPLKLIS
ncbi:uncharacterized protein [Bemisia tabaci]|uniref:uncharacterized protein n=1 Tax=Bemisia tabaci TaxID=7038 RepID=UPI003B27F334